MENLARLHAPDNYERVLRRIQRHYRDGVWRPTCRGRRQMDDNKLYLFDLENLLRKGRVVGHVVEGGVLWYEVLGETVEGHQLRCEFSIVSHRLEIRSALVRDDRGREGVA